MSCEIVLDVVEPKYRPILMSGGMVRRILARRKTQTRRIFDDGSRRRKDGAKILPELLVQLSRDEGGYGSLCPYGRPGDRLWVRETFAPRLDVDPSVEPSKARRYALYRADGTSLDEPHWHHYPRRWTPSILMPRWASRLTLDVVTVRLERLHDISPEDCQAEGLEDPDGRYGWHPETAVHWYRRLWEKLHGPDSWGLNPWVWVVEFRPLESLKGDESWER